MRPSSALVLVLALALAGCSDAGTGGDASEQETASATTSPSDAPRVSIQAEPVVAANTTVSDAFNVTLPVHLVFPPQDGNDLQRARVAFTEDWEWGAMAFDAIASGDLGFMLLPVGETPNVGTTCGEAAPSQYIFRAIGGNLFPFQGTKGAYDIWWWNRDTAGLRIDFHADEGESAASDKTVEPSSVATGWQAAMAQTQYEVDPAAPLGGVTQRTITTAGPSWVLGVAATPALTDATVTATVAGAGQTCATGSEQGTATGTIGIVELSAGVGAGTWTWTARYDGGRPPLPRVDQASAAMVVVGPAPVTVT